MFPSRASAKFAFAYKRRAAENASRLTRTAALSWPRMVFVSIMDKVERQFLPTAKLWFLIAYRAR